MRLRSRLDSPERSQTSAYSTFSLSSTSLGTTPRTSFRALDADTGVLMDGLLRLEGAGILPRVYMIRSTGLTFPALVPVGITRRGHSAALLERLPIDVDEDDGLLPSWTIDPDGGGNRRRPRIDALPHAAGRPTIRAAARQRALAFLEAVLRESGQDLFRRRHPPALRLDPRHPAVTPELRQTAHFSHGPTLEVRPPRGYWTKVPCGPSSPCSEAGTLVVVLKTTVGGRRIVDMLQGEQLPRIC